MGQLIGYWSKTKQTERFQIFSVVTIVINKDGRRVNLRLLYKIKVKISVNLSITILLCDIIWSQYNGICREFISMQGSAVSQIFHPVIIASRTLRFYFCPNSAVCELYSSPPECNQAALSSHMVSCHVLHILIQSHTVRHNTCRPWGLGDTSHLLTLDR